MADRKTNNNDYRNDILNLLILVLIASVLGIYLIATTVVISKDGVMYIELARQFPSEPLQTIRGISFGYPFLLSFGYSFLIFAAHRLAAAFGAGSSILIWVYAAQSVTLLCRVLALIPLYFIGKLLVGGRKSFWAILILIALPYPAEFGSDALRDWPHILFLAGGFLLLLWGAEGGKWWMFGGAGLAAGLGHMIRPECAQLVGYGALWILVRLIMPKPNMNRRALLGALSVLFIGFAIPVFPYMSARGRILPEKLRDYINVYALWEPENTTEPGFDFSSPYTASSLPREIAEGIGRLAEEMSDNLFYYFVPALLLGVYTRARNKSAARDTERFFIPAFVLLNVTMLILLYEHWHYISRRHCLPLVVFLVFYVPVGLEIMARWFEERFSRSRWQMGWNSRIWFFILLAIGVGICMPKLLRPMAIDKWGFRAAAKWLKENTGQDDVIAVPDKRISFYAERKRIEYTSEVPEGAGYVVRIVGSEGGEAPSAKTGREEFSVEVDKRKKDKKRLLIHKRL